MTTRRTALLVGVEFSKNKFNVPESLNELEQLADTSGIQTADKIIQKREKPSPKFFIGQGKVFEIKELCAEENIGAVIFDDELTPAQQRNLEEQIPSRIIDRTRLILDIFAQRARTQEAKFQVELAEKQYELPRLSGKGLSFAQQRGVRGVRTGFGERKIELDRRKINDRIAYLKKEIDKIKYHRETQRSKRRDVPIPVVALIGYTNAGKSTFLNYLTGKKSVYADNKLFATLDATTRIVKLLNHKPVLFTDTVGFIKKLPHQLIAAFKSTMEEITNSDLIVHLIDITNSNYRDNERTVISVLKEIGADKLPILNVFNKCDISVPRDFSVRNYFYISAKTGEGVRELLDVIIDRFESGLELKKITLPYNLFSIIGKINSVGRILNYKPRKDYAELEFLVDKKNWGQIRKLLNEKPYALK